MSRRISWFASIVEFLVQHGGMSDSFGAGLGEGEPLIAEVDDDLEVAAEGFDVGGQAARSSLVSGLACSMADTRPW